MICPADLNGDGCVDGADLGQLLAAWGPCADCDDCPADLTGDCEVDGADLGQLLSAWGTCPAFACLIECTEEEPPDDETIQATTQGDYVPLFIWLIEEGKEVLAVKLLETTGEPK